MLIILLVLAIVLVLLAAAVGGAQRYNPPRVISSVSFEGLGKCPTCNTPEGLPCVAVGFPAPAEGERERNGLTMALPHLSRV